MRKIALAHVYAAGGMSSESERPISIGGYDQIPDEVFAPYDYTALGHLHRPQKTKRDSEKIQYSGSLMRYSFDEVRQKKGIIVGTIDGEGNVSTTFREMLPLHQVREIQGSFADIMAKEGSEDYLQIVLTDSNLSSTPCQSFARSTRIPLASSRTWDTRTMTAKEGSASNP